MFKRKLKKASPLKPEGASAVFAIMAAGPDGSDPRHQTKPLPKSRPLKSRASETKTTEPRHDRLVALPDDPTREQWRAAVWPSVRLGT